tara:strand:- start:42 stop:845 length:804 start_codon:yes stop_codon:yes gene_type:complete
MRPYSDVITFNRNSRGVYSIDPSIGCTSGVNRSPGGCYGDCYAFNAGNRYGYDFGKTVLRSFTSDAHLELIKDQIKKIDMPFIRMGTMGDPSEDWEHTIKTCELLQFDKQDTLFTEQPKEIVIITKHWTNLTLHQLVRLKKLRVCVNTSVSALDDPDILENSLKQHDRLKGISRAILRVVSCDFNLENTEGAEYDRIQRVLFSYENVLDTVFRPSKKNRLVTEGVINTREKRFLKVKQLVSKVNKRTYLGKCENCAEMCGVNMGGEK